MNICKTDFEEIKVSLKKTIGFLEKNSNWAIFIF